MPENFAAALFAALVKTSPKLQADCKFPVRGMLPTGVSFRFTGFPCHSREFSMSLKKLAFVKAYKGSSRLC